MDNEISRLGSTATTDEPEFAYLAPASSPAVYSDGHTDFSKEANLLYHDHASSASYLPRPPHIAIPTSSPSVSGATRHRLDTAVIVGIVLGAVAFVIAAGSIVFYLFYRKRSSGRTRKREPRSSSWIDLERKNSSELSLPPYDEVKAPELGAFALYTKYVPRTLGRLSPVSQTVPPTFDLIKEHHLSSDLSTEPATPPARNGTRKTESPGYLDDISLTVTPFDTRFDS